MTDINLICAADLHLGRQIYHTREETLNLDRAKALGIGDRKSVCGSTSRKSRSFVIHAWERLIELCLNEQPKVDALLLAGDLIDKGGLFIEMYGILRKGILRLQTQGIFVVAVAGNHDAKVLDQFTRALGEFSNFFLLGANGHWERKSFLVRGRRLHLDGISFTDSLMLDNPLGSYKKQSVPDGDALVGLLHCDADVIGSKHAPVRSSDFCALPHHAWILGHIHTSKEIRSENPWVHYCGSLQGLDIGPTECGAKGAWKLTIPTHGSIVSKFLPLAPLRWEQARIDCSAISPQDWESQILKKIEETLLFQIGEATGVEIVGVRLKFEGRTPIYRELRGNLSRIQEQQEIGFILENRWIPYFIESIENNTRPELDLHALAEGRTMAAILAKKLLQAQENCALSKRIYDRIQEKFRADAYMRRCEQAWPEEEECLDLYIHEGYALLEHMQNEIKKVSSS